MNEKMYYVVLSLWLKLALFSIQIMLTADTQKKKSSLGWDLLH